MLAAFCAVLLLNVAVVKSTVMQATPPAQMEHCQTPMPGMAGMDPASGKAPGKAAHAACEFCSAAAHAPLQALAPELPVPCAVSWSERLAWARRGPGGPPPQRAHARAPPSSLLI